MSPEKPEEHSEPNTKKRNPKEGKGKADQQISPAPAKSDMPPTDTKHKNTDDSNKHWLDFATFGVEILGLLGLAIYAILTFGIYKQSQSSATAARDAVNQSASQFQQEQRPYMAQTINSTSGPKWIANPLNPGSGQIVWDWHMTNYGKTPAQNIRFTQEMNLEGTGWKMSYGETGADSGPPQVEGQETYDTVISDPMSKSNFDRLMQTNDGISIRVKINYIGLDGASYETGLCLSRTNAGSITYCPKNKEDNYVH